MFSQACPSVRSYVTLETGSRLGVARRRPRMKSGPPMKAARLLLAIVLAAISTLRLSAQSDLDAFMREVLARRDDNWSKLQQYVLDEHESTELRGPANLPLWGQRIDYTWYIRDGFFVRSPLKVNGVTVSEADRRKYESDFLKSEQDREKRRQKEKNSAEPVSPADEAPKDVDGLIKQTRQPRFISSAYFLRFKFDEGHYALVGRERLEDRDVLRIEYYPTNLFTADGRRSEQDERGRRQREKDATSADQLLRVMNKRSKVTLWIEPTSHQILKYTFDDLGWDFFPGQWLARITAVKASMSVYQAFPDVWLPRGIDLNIGMLFAIGPIDMHYALDYHDYRRADVTSKIGIPDRR
jgi:hypothetical protein